MQRRSSMFLILLCAANFEAGIVLNLILIFELFEARCSYKIVLIKRKECNVHLIHDDLVITKLLGIGPFTKCHHATLFFL